MRQTWSQNCYWNLCRLRGFTIKCNSAVVQNVQCQKNNIIPSRPSPHLRSQTVLRAKRDEFSFSFMLLLYAWISKSLLARERDIRLNTPGHLDTNTPQTCAEKGRTDGVEIQLKKSCVWKDSFYPFYATLTDFYRCSPCNWTQRHVWSFEEPETCFLKTSLEKHCTLNCSIVLEQPLWWTHWIWMSENKTMTLVKLEVSLRSATLFIFNNSESSYSPIDRKMITKRCGAW